MKTPWANLALFGILITLLITGYLGLVSGKEKEAWRLWLHGIAAYALIVVFVWKGTIILDAYRRKNRWTRQRALFAVLLILLLVVVGMGLLWTFNGPISIAGFSLVSLHIYLAVPVMLLMVAHLWQQRFIFRVNGAAGRRLILGTTLAAFVGAILWQTTKQGKKFLGWKSAERRFTGSYERGSFTGQFPVVSWIADDPPPVDKPTWRLTIDGELKETVSFSYNSLLAMPLVVREVILDCTGGWYTRQVWEGIPLADILAVAGISETGSSITVESITGYARRFDLSGIDQALLAFHVAGEPLTHGHGAPLRLVIPGKRGMEWVKWIAAIHVNTSSALWQSPLPLP